MHKKKLILALVGMLLLSLLLVACGQKELPTNPVTENPTDQTENTDGPKDNEEPKTPDNNQSTDDGINKNKDNYKVIANLAEAVSAEDYEAITGIIAFPENSIVTKDDVKYSLTRSDYADLMGQEVEIVDFYGGNTSSSATLKYGAAEVSVRAAIQEDDSWKIEMPSLYIKDITASAPGKCNIVLNGVELDPAKAAKNQDKGDGRVIYTLTVPNRTLQAVVTTDFGELTTEMKRVEGKGTDYSIIPFFDEDTIEALLNAVKDNLNGIMSLYESGEQGISAYEKYFSDGTTADEISKVLDVIAGSYQKDAKGCEFQQILKWEDNPVFAVTNNKAAVNLKFRFSWDNNYSTDYGYLYVERRSDGTYGLVGDQASFATIFDNLLFNYFHHKW